MKSQFCVTADITLQTFRIAVYFFSLCFLIMCHKLTSEVARYWLNWLSSWALSCSSEHKLTLLAKYAKLLGRLLFKAEDVC